MTKVFLEPLFWTKTILNNFVFEKKDNTLEQGSQKSTLAYFYLLHPLTYLEPFFSFCVLHNCPWRSKWGILTDVPGAQFWPFRSTLLAPLLIDRATKTVQTLVGKNHSNLDRLFCLVFVSFFSVRICSCPVRSSEGTFACAFDAPAALFRNIWPVLLW